MVPLALATPGPPEAGEEVVVTTGSPEGAGEDAGPVDVAIAEVDADTEAGAGGDVQAQAAGTATVRHPGTTRRSPSAGPSSPPPRRRSLVDGLLRRKKPTTATTARPATVTAAAVVRVAPTTAATAAPPPPPPTRPPAPSSSDLAWDRLAVCESGNTNDHGAPYYGYWQFSAGTWWSVGETGLPDQYSRAHQLAAAKRLHALRGWSPWPSCSRRLGLT